jgi:catechol 2,3-dioxygenase-like lactoylglutathione lyase family enzyme
MKFGYTIIYVRDVEKTVIFYENAFKMAREFIDEGKQYAQLATGAVVLGFASEELMRSGDVPFVANTRSADPAGFEIAFIADDVGASFEHAVSAGALPIKAPALKPWGQMVAHVRDNNGILIEICSAMNP